MSFASSTTKPTNRAQRRRQQHFQPNNDFKRPESFHFAIRRMENFGNSQQPIPERITLLRPNPSEPADDQLFLDQLPIPRDAWRYDTHDKVLIWKGAFGGGHLYLHHNGRGAVGNIGSAPNPCSVRASFTANFSCAVALDCGVTFESSGGKVTGFNWNPTSTAWKSATWVEDRLSFSYTSSQNSRIDPPTFTLDAFQDNQNEAMQWIPMPGSYTANLSLGERNNQTVFEFFFKSNIAPIPDQGSPTTGPDSVFPYWLQAIEDTSASNIDGAFLIDGLAPNGRLVGLQGKRALSLATGYYRTTQKSAPFGVFNGRMVIGGKPVARSFMSGNVLKWQGLDALHQQLTGLPENGSLSFANDGSIGDDSPNRLLARRLPISVAFQAIADHQDLHPDIHSQIVALSQTLAQTSLGINDLITMTPFDVDSNGNFGDVVQAAVRQDLSTMMNSFIPSDMWILLFPNQNQPTLTGELSIIANSAVPGVDNPTDWYKSLAAAVMSQGMANGSDSNCQNLNGPRAAAWLKTQVSTSPVYHTHGQKLFQYRWQNRYPLINDFLSDQLNTDHTADINLITQEAITDYQTNIKPDPSDPYLLTKIIAEVDEADTYAKTNQLYWAYYYYHYNTTAGILANLAFLMSSSSGSGDGSSLSRLFQQNLTVLTSLDSSGYFARKYTQTINIFLATNILPSMFGFNDDGSDFDLIKEYLQQFVTNNIGNENQQIAAVAAQIKEILDEKNADEQLKSWVIALRAICDTVEDIGDLPTVANNWSNWFKANYPKLSTGAEAISGVFIAGITGLAIFNIILECKQWKKLSCAQATQIVFNAVQLGLEIVTAIVVRGVRIYAVFGVEGMSKLERLAAVSKIIFTGEADSLDTGLVGLGSNVARWLAEAEGTVGKLAEGEDILPLLLNNAAADAEEASWVSKILGDNLDEFMSTRVGPLFILAGIGLSLYFIIDNHEQGIPLASDIINIVGGSLTLFAMVGEWAIAGTAYAEGILASMISFAGPLAILAALAGIGLMLYEIFKTPPDPVQEFVDQYAKPAGFYVPSKAGSIDYTIPYADKGQGNLLMLGFSLSSANQSLCCNADGSIGVGSKTALPAYVWQAATDGLGMTRFLTVAQPDATQAPVVLMLSLMSDQSVSFQPQISTSASGSTPSNTNGPTVVTQTWLSHPQGNASVTSDGNLVSLGLTLQAVPPDAKGNLDPSQASGWLVQTTNGVSINPNQGTVFTLAMSAMAPNFMRMSNLRFLLNSTPGTFQSFGVSFGVPPSTPLSFALSGDNLPGFLAFDQQTGTLAPNGNSADTAALTNNSITASNSAPGKAIANFTITVAASTKPPALLQPA